MDTASQLDSPSEWSNFAPLPSRERTPPSVSSEPDALPLASSPNTYTTESQTTPPPAPTPERGNDALSALPSVAYDPQIFACQNRKCVDLRERHDKTDPRFLFSAQWREMKIGKRRVRVLDLVTHCPDCDTGHVNTVMPVEWLDPSFGI